MKLCCHSLQHHVLWFATLHIVVLVVVQLKLFTMFYDEVVYHKGNIPMGFYIFTNSPILGFYIFYGVCYRASSRKNKCMLTLVIIFQVHLVGILLFAAGSIAYLRDGLALAIQDPYISTITTVFDGRENAINALDVLGAVISVMFVLEVYLLVILVRFYKEIKRLSIGEQLKAQTPDNHRH